MWLSDKYLLDEILRVLYDTSTLFLGVTGNEGIGIHAQDLVIQNQYTPIILQMFKSINYFISLVYNDCTLQT